MATTSKVSRSPALKSAVRKTPAARKAAVSPATKAVTPARKSPARKSPARNAAAARQRPSAGAGRSVMAAQAVKAQAVVKAAKTVKAIKVDKPKKPKLVRDSFTIPKAEYLVLDELKQRAAKAGSTARKSELLRAGIKALAGMGDAAFLDAMRAVPAIKTGRPAAADVARARGDEA